MSTFVRGLDLARAFYAEAVAPLLGDLPHSASLLGWGSDVLGLDTIRSTDHGWGPRLQVFVAVDEVSAVQELIDLELPAEFHGWPTHFGWDEHPVKHHVEVASLDTWLRSLLGFNPAGGVAMSDWLATPQQLLLELTAGAIFRDETGELGSMRQRLAWYPDDVWLWLLACQWRRLAQEEHFVGRTAEVGDDLGSRVVAARLVRDIMRLGFLIERRYAPYSKWLGSAFARLDIHSEIGGALADVLEATRYAARERALAAAVEALARHFDRLRVAAPIDWTVRPFKSRPFLVLDAGRYVDACLAEVSDPWLKSLPLVGGIDQFVDSADISSSSYAERFRAVGRLYAAWAALA
jgi:uncharacterized protein DUF4037